MAWRRKIMWRELFADSSDGSHFRYRLSGVREAACLTAAPLEMGTSSLPKGRVPALRARRV